MQVKTFFMRSDLDRLILGLSFLVIIVGAMIFYKLDPGRYTDEWAHTLQIKRIYRGDDRPVKHLTTLPGYHYTLAYMGKIASPIIDYGGQHPKEQMLRIFQAVLMLLLPIVLFFILKRVKQDQRVILAILSIPILVPPLYFVLTDGWSLVLFLTAFLFCIRKRYDLSAVFILLAVLVRQDNIIWLGLLFGFLLIDVYLENKKVINKKFIINFLSKSIGYLIVLFLFVMFYLFNGGVAMGDETRHPSMSFHFSNIYLYLIMFSFLFLPIIIANIRKIWNIYFKSIKRTIVSSIFIIIGYFFFIQTLIFALHPYNIKTDKFIHNMLLQKLMEDGLFTLVAYGFIILTIGYFLTKPFLEKKYILILPVSALFLSLHWLFEFRYLIIPLILTFIVIKHDIKSLNYQILYGGVLCVIICYIMFLNYNIEIVL